VMQTAVHAVLCASEKIHVVCSERAAGISVQLVALTKCQNWSHSGSERRVTRTTHRNPTFRRHEPTTDLFFITLAPVITLSPVGSIQPTPWSTDPHRLRSISYPSPPSGMWYPKIYIRVQNSLTLVPLLSKMSPVNTFTPFF
jgi:hypothetical protein